MKKIILIVGASGVGKDTLINAAKPHIRANFIKRVIDRKSSPREDNIYLPTGIFDEMMEEFAVSWEANGHKYGVLNSSIIDGINIINASRTAVLKFEAKFKDVVCVEIYADENLLKNRLISRASESDFMISQRLKRAGLKFSATNLIRFDNSRADEASKKDFVNLLSKICKI